MREIVTRVEHFNKGLGSKKAFDRLLFKYHNHQKMQNIVIYDVEGSVERFKKIRK